MNEPSRPAEPITADDLLRPPPESKDDMARRLWKKVPPRVRNGLAAAAVALISLILAVQVTGTGTYPIGPLDVKLSVHPATTGESVVEIPPLGSLTFDSHDGPLSFDAEVEQLDEAKTRQIIEQPGELESQSERAVDDLNAAIKELVVQIVVATVVLTLLLGLILFRNIRRSMIAGAVSLAMLATLLGTVWFTRHPENIRQPQYEGLLSNAPAVIGDAESIYERFGEYQGALIQLIQNFTRVYDNLANLPVAYEPDPNTIRVLHVSDMHLNPVAFDTIQPVADQFKVDVIVDTGDITDWGSSFENQYAERIGQLNKPYVFVRGNHDAQGTADAIAAQPNATVLDDQVADVAGLTFAGVGDPRFTPDKSEGDQSGDEAAVINSAKTLNRTIKQYDATHTQAVDVGLIHDPVGAKELTDVPLVLAGHLHKREQRQIDDDTLLRVDGSTGARGLRGLYLEDPAPLRMSVLYFSVDGKLQAADEITIAGAGQSKVTLDRKIF